MKRYTILFLIALTSLGFARISHAAHLDLITFTFEGIVNDVRPDVDAFNAFSGETLQVTYTFDPHTPDINASPTRGDYVAITEFGVTVGGNTYTQPGPGGAIIVPGAVIVVDTTGLYVATSFDITGPDVGGLTVASFGLILSQPTNTVFTSDALPTVQLDIEDFANRVLSLDFQDDALINFGRISSRVRVVAQPIPEPATLLLFGSGLAGVAALRRKSKAKV